MSRIKKTYLNLYVFVLALYVYFNKGVAYSFLAETVLVLGVLLILFDRKRFEILWEKRTYLLVLFLIITTAFLLKGLMNYSWFNVVRDAFMFYYLIFVFIIFLFKEELPYLINRIVLIYKWFPVVACISFLTLSYFPFSDEIKFFGNNPLLLYKFGDMAVHLFISTILLLSGYIRFSKRFLLLNSILIVYLFFIISTYSRGGMLAFVCAILIFLFFVKDQNIKKMFSYYGKFLLLIILFTFPIFLATKVKENFQGRILGVEQLKENIVSIVNPNAEGTLSDNKIWRLIWWTKIIQYTFGGEYFFQGKGLGMSLVSADEIVTDDLELRSPHNFHLNVLARFGVPIFLLWLGWLYFNFKNLWTKNENKFLLIILSIMSAFVINAAFDVFFEGPMGAFPFWTFVGIYYVAETFEIPINPEIISKANN